MAEEADPKRVFECAPTSRLERLGSLTEEFMRRIFGFEPDDYLITDESSLRDFQGVDGMTIDDIHRKILDAYGVNVSEHELLVEILEALPH